jgi:hypothetical protein
MILVCLLCLSFFSLSEVSANTFPNQTINASPNSNINIPITLNSSDNINAVNTVLTLDNVTYVSVQTAGGWSNPIPPTINGNTITIPFAFIANTSTGTFTIGQLTVQSSASNGAIQLDREMLAVQDDPQEDTIENPITPAGLISINITQNQTFLPNARLSNSQI